MTLLEEWKTSWPTFLNRSQSELWVTLQNLGVEAGWEDTPGLRTTALTADQVGEPFFLFVVKYQGKVLIELPSGVQKPMGVVRAALLQAAILLQQQGIEVVPAKMGL